MLGEKVLTHISTAARLVHSLYLRSRVCVIVLNVKKVIKVNRYGVEDNFITKFQVKIQTT